MNNIVAHLQPLTYTLTGVLHVYIFLGALVGYKLAESENSDIHWRVK